MPNYIAIEKKIENSKSYALLQMAHTDDLIRSYCARYWYDGMRSI